MSNKLVQVLNSPNPQALQNYIKLYLSNQPDNLQRIYQQLQNYQTKLNPQQKKYNSQQLSPLKRNQSQNTIKNKVKINYTQKSTQKYLVKRSQTLMRNLKDKFGIKIQKSDNQQRGQKVYQKNIKKIIKPLKCHPDFHLLKNPTIVRQLSRYYINQKYYQNQIDDANINGQQQYDKQMKQFLERRNNLLQQLKNKKITQNNTSNNFLQINSKYLTKTTLPNVNTNKNQQLIQQTNHIMNQCDQYHQKCYLPRTITQNLYSELRNRIYPAQAVIDQIQQTILDKVKQNIQKQLYDKYDHTYMKMMAKRGEKMCKLNKHQKDLLKNQIKMRNLINFSSKGTKK